MPQSDDHARAVEAALDLLSLALSGLLADPQPADGFGTVATAAARLHTAAAAAADHAAAVLAQAEADAAALVEGARAEAQAAVDEARGQVEALLLAAGRELGGGRPRRLRAAAGGAPPQFTFKAPPEAADRDAG